MIVPIHCPQIYEAQGSPLGAESSGVPAIPEHRVEPWNEVNDGREDCEHVQSGREMVLLSHNLLRAW